MNTAVKDQLRRLIKSMTKSEKRNFKLYAKRVSSNANSKFIQLFDLIDSQVVADDEALLNTVGEGQNGKLSNLKRHLYQQVLISMRLVHISKQPDIQVRQQIDFARILYGKGHYLDALRLLERIKPLAQENNYDLLLLEVLEFQKLIEARHVTRSRQMKNKMDQLVRESTQWSEINLHTSVQSNINIQIQGYYILNGHTRNKDQRQTFDAFWIAVRSRANTYPTSKATFFERINRYQSNMWRHYILLDLEAALADVQNCYNLFRIESEMPLYDPDLFLRILYYINAFAFLTENTDELARSVENINRFTQQQAAVFNKNSQQFAFIYVNLCRLNLLIHQKAWSEAKALSKEIQEVHAAKYATLPNHRLNLFRYKFAAIDFANQEYDVALDQLSEILNSQIGLLREDLLINTRFLQIFCYLETKDFYLADYALTNLSRMIRRNKYAGQIHTTTITSIRKALREEPSQWPQVFIELEQQLTPVQKDPYEAKSLRFLDILSWARSHYTKA